MKATGRIAAACLAFVLAGCSGNGTPAPTASSVAAAPAATSVTATPSPVTAAPAPPATATSPAAATATPERTTAHIDVDGLTRDYAVVVPSDVSTRGALPLLLMLHGPNVTTAEAESISGLDALAVEPGAVLVYPEAAHERWLASDCCQLPGSMTDFDVTFIAALVNHIEADYSVDPNRVFIGGDGTGGAMAYRAACVIQFAAVAVVGTNAELLVDCTPARPISVLDIYGSDDTVTLSDGGAKGCGGPCPTVAQTMERWRQADGCTGEPTTSTEGIVVTTTLSTCSGGVVVEFIEANGLNDTWLGPGIDDLAVIWTFLMDHPRPTLNR